MPPLDLVLIVLAGVGAGTINAIVGSGTLITFPTLVMLGYPPLVANMSNSLGLLPGGLSGAYGYRREIRTMGAVLRRLMPASLAGGLVGALLLLVLPPSVFDAVVPALVLFGLVLVVLGPRLQRLTAAHHAQEETRARRVAAPAAAFFAGIYGGYFGAAQGIILVGLLSLLMTEDLQLLNGMKNVLVPLVNLIATVVFVVLRWHEIDWLVALLIGIGSFVGGYAGATVGRRLNPAVLRAVIVVVGTIALVRLVA